VKALRYHGAGDLRLEDVPEVEPDSGWVKLAVACCGICGTDVDEYRSGPKLIPPPDKPHVLTGETLPLTIGHEFSGEVVALGDGVDDLKVGDRVAIEPSIACHECPACAIGQYNRCHRRGAVGLNGWGGGFAEYETLPRELLHRLPDGMSLEAGALVEPIAVGWHAAKLGGAQRRATALVVGAGPIGIGALVSLKALGADLAIVAARREGARSRLARDFGADRVVLSSAESVVDVVGELTGGAGVDLAIETSGTQAGLDDAIGAVRIGGTVVTVGLWDGPAQVDPNLLLLREISLVGSRGYAGEDFPSVIAAIADGAIPDVERMVTARVPLDAAVTDGIEALVNNRRDHLKILVVP
jgi:(R,R)-butanediol dehydrogenase/meso-butanediol dehydrogenase/diacetyl reductase